MNDVQSLTARDLPQTLETVDDLFPEGQIRLAEISVSNWGTFHGKQVYTAQVDPKGTLVTGHTGAGKTTLIDAHQVLLLPPGSAYFNVAAAQSDRKDRSLLTYVRGKYASSEDSNGRDVAKYKRPREALSGVRAMYRTDTGREYTLAALFWVGPDASSVNDVHRLYVVARRNLQLKDLLNQIRGEGGGAPRPSQLIKAYDGDETVHVIQQKFDSYAVFLYDLLGIENEKAPALLSRAMGLKRIDDLTELVRTLVLEEPDTRQAAIEAIAEFHDLKAIHAELEMAQARAKMLHRFPEYVSNLTNHINRRKLIGSQRVATPVWYARQRVAFLDGLISELEAAEERLKGEIQEAQLSIEGAVKSRENAQRIFDSAGGDKLQLWRERERLEQEKVSAARRERDHVAALLESAGLTLEQGWSEGSFLDAKREAARMVDRASEEAATIRQQSDDAIIKQERERRALAELLAEVRMLEEKPDSAIPRDDQIMRAELCRELGVTSNEMPFLGELINVAEEHAEWRGAIERALGFQRLRLLVEPELGKRLTRLLNERHMGRRVGVEFVRVDTPMTVFKEHSFLRKLEWKQHPFREWLKRYLSDSSLDCVESVDAMRARPHSMTVAGLIHRREGSFEKNDGTRIDDRRYWYLGFSSEAKKQWLAVEVGKVTQRVNDCGVERERIETLQGELEGRIDAGKRLSEITWDAINVEARHAEVLRIRQAIEEIEGAGVDLKKAESDLNAAKAEEQRCRDVKGKLEIDLSARGIGKAERQQHRGSEQVKTQVIVDEWVIATVAERFTPLALETFLQEVRQQDNASERRTLSILSDESESVVEQINAIKNGSTSIMSVYRREHTLSAADLKDRSSAVTDEEYLTVLSEWNAHYLELKDSKLPDLRERFETSLNIKATQSLTVIAQRVRSQAEEIEDRIEQVNRVLRETDFRPGMYLAIAPIQLKQEAVSDFNRQLQDVTRQVALGDVAAHFAAIQRIIATLERATDPSTRGNKDSQCQLDARYRMDFAARVIDRATGEPKDYMRNTGGKSGGEKESFSGSIVAAALAYALTPAGGRRPTYCTVFLDEAFANTSDTVAKRVLAVFQKLGLHLNMITPFKNVQLVRHVVNSAVIVSVDGEMNSDLSEATWEEIDRQRMRNDENLKAQARRLGVEVEDLGEGGVVH